jgi:hypothetical protein
VNASVTELVNQVGHDAQQAVRVTDLDRQLARLRPAPIPVRDQGYVPDAVKLEPILLSITDDSFR